MIVVALIMLLVPGLISVRILWREKEITKGNYKYIVCDYLVYSFLILLAVYAVMFFGYPHRTVSFSTSLHALSHISHASFVFKYMFTALLASLVLPYFVKGACKLWLKLEDNRSKRIEKEKSEKGKK